MIWYAHAHLCKFIYSVMKNNKVKNWSQEIHAITPYIDFEHIKGIENILAGSVSWIQTLGLYEAKASKKDGHEYGESIFDSETETVCSVENNEKVNQDFEANGVKYQLDVKHVDDLSLHDTAGKSRHHDPFNAN